MTIQEKQYIIEDYTLTENNLFNKDIPKHIRKQLTLQVGKYIRENRVKDIIELEKSQFYNGNLNLRRRDIEIPHTAEQIEEYMKCGMDVIYFIKNYCEIVTIDNGLQPFIPYPYQIDMLQSFENNKKNICLLGRQLGKCVSKETNIKVRNKKTNEINDIKIGEFFDMINKSKQL